MEAALDYFMSTLETDSSVIADGVPVLHPDPAVQELTCHRSDDAPYTKATEVLVKDITAALLQSTLICDKVFRGPTQQNDLALSPVSVAFSATQGLPHAYVMPTWQQIFDFVDFYVDYYDRGPGESHVDATRRVENMQRVRFNIETKINPWAQFAAHTIEAEPFAEAVAAVISENRRHQSPR